MQSNNQDRRLVTKRKRKPSDSGTYENNNLTTEKQVKTGNTENESSVSELFSNIDERVPLVELTVPNLTTSSPNNDSSPLSFSLDVLPPSSEGDKFITESWNSLISDLEQIGCESTSSPTITNIKDIAVASSSSTSPSLTTYRTRFLPRKFVNKSCPLPVLNWSDEVLLWNFLGKKDKESLTSRNIDYFRQHLNVHPRMRSILVEWLLEVSAVHKLQRETYFLAVDYVDRYLSLTRNISKKHLQLVGVTCLFIASKYEECYPPKLSIFAYITDGTCTVSDILNMELDIIKVLNWQSAVITPNRWLIMLLQVLYQSETKKDLEMLSPLFPLPLFDNASQLLDLCSLDEEFLKYSYKTIAVSVLYLSTSNKQTLNILAMSYEEISDCVNWLITFWQVLKPNFTNTVTVDNDLTTTTTMTDDKKVVTVGEEKWKVEDSFTVCWESVCRHHVNLDLLEEVQLMKKTQQEPPSLPGLLTPPPSSKKSSDTFH